MAVLTGNTFFACGTLSVLLVNDFKAYTGLHNDLVTASAERAIGKLFELDRTVVNRLQGPFVLQSRFLFFVVFQ